MCCSRNIQPAPVATSSGSAAVSFSVAASAMATAATTAGTAAVAATVTVIEVGGKAIASTVDATRGGARIFMDAWRGAQAQAQAEKATELPQGAQSATTSFTRYTTKLNDPATLRAALEGAMRSPVQGQRTQGVVLNLAAVRVDFGGRSEEMRPELALLDGQGNVRVIFTRGGQDDTLLAYVWGESGEVILREAIMAYVAERVAKEVQQRGYKRAHEAGAASLPMPHSMNAADASTASTEGFALMNGYDVYKRIDLLARQAAQGNSRNIELQVFTNHHSSATGCDPIEDILDAIGLSGMVVQVENNPAAPFDNPGGVAAQMQPSYAYQPAHAHRPGRKV